MTAGSTTDSKPMSFEEERKNNAKSARDNPFFVSQVVEQVIASLGELATSNRWLTVRTTIDNVLQQASDCYKAKPEEIVCYCLGDLSEHNVSFQLAFLLLMANQLAIPPSRRLVFDPLHTEKDHEILKLCGCTVLSHDEGASRRVNSPTLFYMPFAPFYLTDNVVRANWDVLERVTIIGNPLRWVVDHKWDRSEAISKGNELRLDDAQRRTSFRSRAPCVEAALELVNEVTLWNGDLVTWRWTHSGHATKREANAQAREKHDDAYDSCNSAQAHESSLAQVSHALNSTIAIFAQPPRDWPKQPPRAEWRSRL